MPRRGRVTTKGRSKRSYNRQSRTKRRTGRKLKAPGQSSRAVLNPDERNYARGPASRRRRFDNPLDDGMEVDAAAGFFNQNNRNAGMAGDVTFQSVKLGQKMESNGENAMKLSLAGMDAKILRFQACSDYSAPLGFHTLNRQVLGPPLPPQQNAQENMPLIAFNLTAIVNNSTDGNPAVCKRLTKFFREADAPPEWIWTNLDGNLPNGTGGALTYNNDTTAATGAACTTRFDILEWLDIRMDCVGAQALPTQWEVKIVQFGLESLTPDYQPKIAPVQADEQNVEHVRKSYWDGEIQPYITHPILPMTNVNSGKEHVKILWKTNFTTQPKDSTDRYQSGNEKIIKIFQYLNRTSDYGWATDARPPAPGALGQERMGYPQSVNQLRNDVEPEKRLYLIIKCQNHYFNVGQEEPAVYGATGSSFDIVIRKKHLCQI